MDLRCSEVHLLGSALVSQKTENVSRQNFPLGSYHPTGRGKLPIHPR